MVDSLSSMCEALYLIPGTQKYIKEEREGERKEKEGRKRKPERKAIYYNLLHVEVEWFPSRVPLTFFQIVGYFLIGSLFLWK